MRGRAALLLIAGIGLCPALAAETLPAPPYFTVQLASMSSEDTARELLKELPADHHPRIERRTGKWAVRVGVYDTREAADAALKRYKAGGYPDASVIGIVHPVPWLLPDGTTLPVPAELAQARPSEPPPAAAPVPAPPKAAAVPKHAPEAAAPQRKPEPVPSHPGDKVLEMERQKAALESEQRRAAEKALAAEQEKVAQEVRLRRAAEKALEAQQQKTAQEIEKRRAAEKEMAALREQSGRDAEKHAAAEQDARQRLHEAELKLQAERHTSAQEAAKRHDAEAALAAEQKKAHDDSARRSQAESQLEAQRQKTAAEADQRKQVDSKLAAERERAAHEAAQRHDAETQLAAERQKSRQEADRRQAAEAQLAAERQRAAQEAEKRQAAEKALAAARQRGTPAAEAPKELIPPPATAPPATGSAGVTVWTPARVTLDEGLTLEGEGRREFTLPLPPGATLKGADLVLDIEFGELATADSSLQVAVNGSVRRAVRRGASAATRVTVPLNAADLQRRDVRVELAHSLAVERAACASHHAAGASARIAPTSGLVLAPAEAVPRTLRAAWSLLPPEVVVARPPGALSAAEFETLFQLATLLDRDGYRARFVPADDPAAAAPIVLARSAGGTAPQLVRLEGRAGEAARAYILIDAAQPLPPLLAQMHWRRAAPAGHAAANAAVTLGDLGFTDGTRRFGDRAAWRIPVPFAPLGDGRAPAAVRLALAAPRREAGVMLSASFNDRVVFSGPPAEALQFDVPPDALRAANVLRLEAEAPAPAGCAPGPAVTMAVLPASEIVTRQLRETPASFAELLARQRALELHVSRAALAAPDAAVALLVSLGAQLWPDVAPPALHWFDDGAPPRPAAPFVAVGPARWDADALMAPVPAGHAPYRIVSNGTGTAAAIAPGAAVLQVIRAAGEGGAWLDAVDAAPLPADARLDDGNAVFLAAGRAPLSLRIGPGLDYRAESAGATEPAADSPVLLLAVLGLLAAGALLYWHLKARRPG